MAELFGERWKRINERFEKTRERILAEEGFEDRKGHRDDFFYDDFHSVSYKSRYLWVDVRSGADLDERWKYLSDYYEQRP